MFPLGGRRKIVRCYMGSFGALFFGLGFLTIFAPTGGLLLLLGIVMLVVCGMMSLSVYAYHGIARVAHAVALPDRLRQVAVRDQARPAPAPHSLRPLHR